MHTSSQKPIFRCILPREGRGHPCARRWRCTSRSVHSINLFYAGHQVLCLNRQGSDWAFHLQLQPGNGFASIGSKSGSSRRRNVENLLREENAIVRSVLDEVEGRRSDVGEVMVAGKYRAGSEGMYGCTVVRFGIGVPNGDGRDFVEDVGGVAIRSGYAGHAGGVVEIGNGSNGKGNGRRAPIRRASIILGMLLKRETIEEKRL